MEKVGPFIHLFKTSGGRYLYDVNTDKILKLERVVYDFLKNKELSKKEREYAKEKIEVLKNQGYLKKNRVKYTEHPITELLPYYLDTRLNYLILQVTQNCNLRCEYCVYSGKYNTRTHSNKKMSVEMAKQGIDYLIEHSRDSWNLSIGFYGGEPLLEMDLIKECVKYVEELELGKKVRYSMTTNATLLNDENVDFLVKKNFDIMISLDGPKEIHDINRRFAYSGKGSFDVLKNNLARIKEKYPHFYGKNISFNTVFTAKESLNCISEYFLGEDLFKDSMFSSSIVSDEYAKEETVMEEQFVEELRYEQFKLLLAKIGILEMTDVSIVVRKGFEHMQTLFEKNRRKVKENLPEKDHHGGPCIPGVQRLFLNAYGEFFPCEKVCETAKITKIGNIENGINVQNAQNILNIEKFTEEQCHNCWAYSMCRICINCATEEIETLSETIEKRCILMRAEIEELLKDYCALREWGYDFEYDSTLQDIIEFEE